MNEPSTTKVKEGEVPRMPAFTDDMIAKLSSNAESAATLIDQVQSSGLAKAIPTLGGMANNGDMQRLAHLARMYAAAEDAVTDEMVCRLTDAVGGGLTLIDQVQRAGLERALPALVALVENGDLERLVQLARVYSSAEDAVTEEMVGRLAETVGTGLSLLDRLNRGGGERIVAMLERLENTGALEKVATTIPLVLDRLEMIHRLFGCIEQAAAESQSAPQSTGGVGGLWGSVKDGDSQDTLRFLLLLGKKLRATACGG